MWTRHHNTVPREGAQYFGYSGSWRHNWQFDLLERRSVDGSRPKYVVIYPEGTRRVLLPTSNDQWAAADPYTETMIKTSDGFDLQLDNPGSTLHFVERTSAKGYHFYTMEQLTDHYGLVTMLTYNAQGLLTRVTEPAGRFFQFCYQDITYQSGRYDRQIGTIPTAPARGQWIELTVPAQFRGQAMSSFCLRGEGGARLAVAEIQFLTENSSIPVPGKITGTGNQPSAANDGDLTTAFVGSREAENVLCFDPADPTLTTITRVRILAAAGQENSLLGAWLDIYAIYSNVRPVVKEVVGSDGSRVTYEYQTKSYTWGYGPAALTVELIGASYADKTHATYRYEEVGADRKPILVEASDPRYIGRAKRIRYSFHDQLGMIHQEINPEGGRIYASLEVDPKNPERRTVTYSDLRQTSFLFPKNAKGRPTERTDSLGRTTHYEYANGGAGVLVATTDHLGRRTEHSYNSRKHRTATKAHGRIRNEDYDVGGLTTKGTDFFGRETIFTRDARGRVIAVRYPDKTERAFAYDALGRQTLFRDKDGGTHTYTYDARGLKTAWQDPRGYITRYGYDARDRVAEITNPLGLKTKLEYNDRGLVTKRVKADGRVQSFTYDDRGRKIAATDEQGRTTKYTYDELERLVRSEDDKGGVTTFDYTELPQGCGSCSLVKNPSRVVYPDGRVVSNLYDAEGRLLSRTNATGTSEQATTTYTYDEDNNLIAVVDSLGGITRSTYDDEHHRISTTDPLGRTTLWAYDDRGNVLSMTAPSGAITKNEHDSNDRLIKTTDAAGNATRYSYDVLGNVTQIIDALGQTTRHEYDGKRRTATILPDGTRQTWEYDAAERVIKTTNPDGAVSTMTYDAGDRVLTQTIVASGQKSIVSNTYDALGRRLSTTDVLGRTIHWTYDAHGNVLQTSQPDGSITTNTYDDRDRVLTTTDALGQTTYYAYDTANNLVSLTDAKGSTYRFTYDAARRKTAMVYPDNSKETWIYDASGRITRYTNRSGQTKTIAYNAVGRPLSETWTPTNVAQDIDYTYNGDGRLIALKNGLAQLTYTYDVLGRIASETTDVSALVPGLASTTVSYRYDPLGRRQRLVYPDGSKIAYAYDSRSRFVSIDDGGKGRPLAAYTYDVLGRVAQLTRDNGVQTAYVYDMAGQLTNIAHTSGGQTLASAHYEIDMLGRRTELTREDNLTEHYAYDITSELTAVNYGTGKSESFAYDAVGNRTRFTDGRTAPSPRVTDYTTNNLNQYTQVGGVAFTYDGNGNLLADGTQSYLYNANNQLIAVENAAARAEFFYDAKNRCVLRKYYTKGSQGQWILSQADSRALTYDTAWNLLSERKLNGQQVGEYVYGSRTDEILNAQLGSQNYYPIADVLGSTVALSDNAGKVTERYRCTPFGTVLFLTASYKAAHASAVGYRFLFTGREWLASVSLNDHRNRYYCPRLGRWLTVDPIGLKGGLNLYAYVDNSVLGRVDSYGLAAGDNYTSPQDAACAALRDANSASISQNIEYAGVIYEREGGGYTYTAPWPGTKDESSPFAIYTGDYSKVVGKFHTHGNYTNSSGKVTCKGQDAYNSDKFSDTDKQTATDLQNFHDYLLGDGKQTFNFLGTPSGTFLQDKPNSLYSEANVISNLSCP
jgi:RHS repeat-associated protein